MMYLAKMVIYKPAVVGNIFKFRPFQPEQFDSVVRIVDCESKEQCKQLMKGIKIRDGFKIYGFDISEVIK